MKPLIYYSLVQIFDWLSIEQTMIYLYLDRLVLFLILYTLAGLVGEYGEKRILVFFIYFELIQLLLATMLILGALFQPVGQPAYLTMALILLGASGAETAIFLALFMRYFRLTGLTTFMYNKNKNSSLKYSEKNVNFRFFPK
jgi:NADH:ubiquinone oxidoreductase subunit K